ncbi:MAG: transcription antitermination factor NusB [Pseudomonadota bacterium]
MSRPHHPHHARQWSRRLAMQAIYQWQMTAQDLVEIERQFYTDENLHKADLSYFRELLHQVPAHLEELDMRLGKHLDRPVAEVDPVERAVLRNGCYELIYRRDIPYKVVINEAIRLTKKFGAEHGYRFINGVLDGVVKDLHKSSATSSPQR